MTKKIPILALTGFLGAGKTTLLNHLLKDNQGLKIGVIVNDFGAINIDALLVAKQTDSKLELSNGCICCASEESGLDDAISQLAHAGSLIDYIIIEASGLAEPRELAFILQNSRNKYAELDAVISVVDAETVLDMHEKHPDFFKQIEIADIIVLNKVDLVSTKKRKEVIGYINFLNDHARIIEAVHGQVDSRLLLDIDSAHKRQSDSGEQLRLGNTDSQDHTDHLHETYQKTVYETTKPLDPKALELFLTTTLPTSIYRAKGFVYFGMKGLEQKFLLQLVGQRYTLSVDEWRGQPPKTELVFIGEKFDEQKLTSELEKTIDPTPDDIAGNLLDLALYR